ncbi:hypothetical protein AQUCO_01100094v1 [Aquilegia coerulea]|uniref:TF-B3 domain-containing protein n=1 Tax=Aquilegia coerulea TaxID=218851 RepID=A0A2G5E5K1_AQUCA|nr:hypothetical protein AQUCO_01100094v1 [Aquilegia coerulea]
MPTKEEEEKGVVSGEFPLTPIRTQRVEIRNTPPKLLDLLTPWECEKVMTASDVSHYGAVVLGREHIQRHWGLDWTALNRGTQVAVTIRDVETRTDHNLLLRKTLEDVFLLHNNWLKDFVFRRNLKEGDTIGMYWNRTSSSICFSVLKRATGMRME